MRQVSKQHGSRLKSTFRSWAQHELKRAQALAVVSEHASQLAALGERVDKLRWSHAGVPLEIPPLLAVQRECTHRCVYVQALNLISNGLSDRDIARTTGLSRLTVARIRSAQ